MRHLKNIYIFISDKSKKFYKAVQQTDGSYAISKQSSPYPIKYNPKNILESEIEFATNRNYFSLNRSISYPLEFIKDGAAILREIYYKGKGSNELAYITILEWNGETNLYDLSYKGRIDFTQKKEDPKSGVFTVSTVDDSAWGLLSQNDDIEYAIDCSRTNTKAVKVLIDSITLKNNYTFQTVNAAMVPSGAYGIFHICNFLEVNQDGTSYGIITKNNTSLTLTDPDFSDYIQFSKGGFFMSFKSILNINISGKIKFHQDRYDRVEFFIFSSRNYPTSYVLHSAYNNTGIYESSFNLNITVQPQEYLYLVCRVTIGSGTVVTPIVTNIIISTSTKADPVISYALRPLDLLNEIVEKATFGRYSINSNYFSVNNRSVCLSGDSIRGIQNSLLYTSFKDFFKTFDCLNFMALKEIGDDLFIEKADYVYGNNNIILDIGECIDLEIIPANEYFFNQIEVGSKDIDFRRPAGRLEFNSTNTFSLPFYNVSKKMDLISKYRLGCYDVMFLILDHLGLSTKDNTGDKSVYVLDISDEKQYAIDQIENFENININNASLAPLIKYPLTNSTITYNKPVLRGLASPSTLVNIYIDGILEGNCTSDANGNWEYFISSPLSEFISGVQTGEHVINATYSDLLNPFDEINVVIDIANPVSSGFIYPSVDDTIYNNKPLIKGFGQFGENIDLYLDGVLIGSTTCDQSCGWRFQSGLINNGVRDLRIGLSGATISFEVDTDVEVPLITYIEGDFDGFTIFNNLPLIKGVARPNETVNLFLDYISYYPLGTTIADANGNWEYQVVPVTYIDILSGLPVVLAPIKNGLNIISTGLVVATASIGTKGYKLNRPNYSLISGVIDNTVFNVEFSPKRMLDARKSMLASIMNMQRTDLIEFQKSTKNGNLKTVLNGIAFSESDDIKASDLGEPLAILEYAQIKTKTKQSFAKTLKNFNNASIIKSRFRGNDIFLLPIGNMKMSNIRSDVQEWKLLVSPLTSYNTLLNLYKNGLTITIMQNSVFHSDYNSLHFFKYDFEQLQKYNTLEMYDETFSKRNSQWSQNPKYLQKFQKTDVIKDQIITKGLSQLQLRIFKCGSDIPYKVYDYEAVNPAPIQSPEVVLDTEIDFSLYQEGRYYAVLSCKSNTGVVGNIVQINDYTVSFEALGEIIVGDKVYADIIIDGILHRFISTVLAGWTLYNVTDDLQAQMISSGIFVYVNRTVNVVELSVVATSSISALVYSGLSVTYCAMSELIDIKQYHRNTILIESRNSINLNSHFYSSGISSVIRVEGLVKKLQPDVTAMSARNEIGDSTLIHSIVSKKRNIRFGTAYGLPDYLYLKIANCLTLDDLKIEGENYTLYEDEKINPSEDVEGHPLYYYNVNLALSENLKGFVFPGAGTSNVEGVTLVVDATAFGMPTGSLINIDLE